MIGDFLYKRDVNQSVLFDGFGIDRDYLDLLLCHIGPLRRGEKHNIKLIIGDGIYDAVIKNLNNPEDKRKHDAYQVRYSGDGKLSKALQSIFFRTYNYIQEKKIINEVTGDKHRIIIPDSIKEYISFYATDDPFTFACETIVSDELKAVENAIVGKSEYETELLLNSDYCDKSATVITRDSLLKVRKLNRKIGDTLKSHYKYRCQICGRPIGERYGSCLIEAHHIDYFVKSLNNDISNILIVCPNHHGIIHDRNPRFDCKLCEYTYPNGYKEGLILNDHLGMATKR